MKHSQVKTNVSGPSPLILSESETAALIHGRPSRIPFSHLRSLYISFSHFFFFFLLAGHVSQNELQMTTLIVISLSTEEFISTSKFLDQQYNCKSDTAFMQEFNKVVRI